MKLNIIETLSYMLKDFFKFENYYYGEEEKEKDISLKF